MDIRPIFSALRRHKTAATLIVLEIALSCAILSNAVFLIHTRLQLMDRPTGLAEPELVRIELADPDAGDSATAQTREELVALRELPGVRNAAAVNVLPLSGRGRSLDVRRTPDEAALFESSFYAGDVELIDAMGLNLIAGRRFTQDEFIEWDALTAPNSELAIPSAIVSRTMAEVLFPGEDPLGKSFYAWGDSPITIVGIVEHLVQPHGANGETSYTYAMLLPVEGAFGTYLLRVTDPSQRAQVLEHATLALKRIDPNRIIVRHGTVEEMRDSYYRTEVEMTWLLAIVCMALLVITAFGIVGLASFWVQQRTRQIGIRRALGATRGQILRYFQTENVLLVTLGIVLGMLLAYGINLGLMQHYELPRLPAMYLPIGAVTLWLLGQIAVFGPARRAAAVPPAVATRSV